jgi:hypothetical protein
MAADAGITWGDVWTLTREVFGPGVGLLAIGAVWRSAAGWKSMQKDQDALREDHVETKRKLSVLEEKINAARETIAGLATKDDLERLGERMQSQIQMIFSQLLTLLGFTRKDP